MKYFDAFSGVGGFALGITQAYEKLCITNKEQGLQRTRDTKGQCGKRFNERSDGLTCVGYSEIDKYAIQIYEKHFNHKNYGDCTTIDPKELPDFDLLVGGFPCQAFSIAGKRQGFADTRGTLFFDIARIVREKQPRLLLLENVKGLLSHDKGATFYTIISTLDELGYDCQWQVLNSKNHGVPQNRERVFIIGHLRGTSRPQVFPFAREGGKDVPQGSEEQGRGSWVSTLDSRYGERWSSETYVQLTETRTEEAKEIRRNTKDRDFSPRRGKVLVPRTGDKANTVPTASTKEQLLMNDSKIRRLTPTECERLQGFPDGWTEGVSDTQRYKTLGNAVTVNVVNDIVEKLL